MTLLWVRCWTRDCLKSLSGWIFLWFRKISAATYREKNEVKEYPLTLVPTHQPLTSAAFASTAESACWHCLHQRAGCLKYQRSCPASAPLSHSYKCNRVLWAQVSHLLLVAWQAIPGCCRLFLIHYKLSNLFLGGLTSSRCKGGLVIAGMKQVIPERKQFLITRQIDWPFQYLANQVTRTEKKYTVSPQRA